MERDLLGAIAKKIEDFNLSCHLLVCGFDLNGAPHLFTVIEPGVSHAYDLVGFHAVGSGYETAIGRLLWQEVNPEEELERILYGLFDAKASAEIIQGVGYEWDGQIMVHGKDPMDVPDRIKKIIDQVWVCKSQSPFERDVDEDDVPPRTWKRILKTYAEECLTTRAESKAAAGET